MPVSRAATHQRLHAQLLAGPKAASPLAVATRLLAIQGQDLRGFRLAVRARCDATSVSALDAALADRELVVSWLVRGTLHLVASEDYWWLHSLVAPQLQRPLLWRLGQLGIAADVARQGWPVAGGRDVANRGAASRHHSVPGPR